MAFGRTKEESETRSTVEPYAPPPTEAPEFKTLSEQIASALQHANAITDIVDAETASQATDVLKGLKHARQDAEKYRRELGRFHADAKARIDATYREAASPVLAAERSIKDRLLAYEQAERAKAEAARKAEIEEAERLQKIEDEAAAEEGRAGHHVAAPAPKKRPTGARGASGAKATPTRRMSYEIVDVDELPDRYVRKEPIRSLIKASVDAGEYVPGIRVFEVEDMQVR